MTKQDNPFKKAIDSRKQESPVELPPAEPIAIVPPQPTPPKREVIKKNKPTPPVNKPDPVISTPKKKGRPATGKRSDELWVGRTYYIQRANDLDVEDELLRLKRQGIDIDKSELVDFLLGGWVKFRQGENLDIYISEITPRQ